MMDFDTFKLFHSETIMYYQIIENDIKVIYAYIQKGDARKNYDFILTKSLGQAVIMLKEIGTINGRKIISDEDFNFLLKVTKDRNYWCHYNYIDFMYLNKPLESKEYMEQAAKLNKSHEKLKKIYVVLEQLREKIAKEFKR